MKFENAILKGYKGTNICVREIADKEQKAEFEVLEKELKKEGFKVVRVPMTETVIRPCKWHGEEVKEKWLYLYKK